MIILGINAYHADSAAALVRDGKLIAAAEEERFRRVKHWAGFPTQALAYCLQEAKVSLSDVDHIALNQDNRANLFRKAIYFGLRRPRISLVLKRLANRQKREGCQHFSARSFRIRCFGESFITLNTILRISPRLFRSRRLNRRQWFLLTALVTSQARLGVWHTAVRSKSRDEYFFRTRSAFSIRQ